MVGVQVQSEPPETKLDPPLRIGETGASSAPGHVRHMAKFSM